MFMTRFLTRSLLHHLRPTAAASPFRRLTPARRCSTFTIQPPQFSEATYNFSAEPVIERSKEGGGIDFVEGLGDGVDLEFEREEMVLDGCDFEHWLVVMRSPEGEPEREEVIDRYVKILASAVGSEEEARKKIYSISTKHYYAFGAQISEEDADKLKEFPGVNWVLPDSYLNCETKDYGGEPFINGQAVPYDPKYHEDWVINNALQSERGDESDLEFLLTDDETEGVYTRDSGSNVEEGPEGNMEPIMAGAPQGNTTKGSPMGTSAPPDMGGVPQWNGGMPPNYVGYPPHYNAGPVVGGGAPPNMGGMPPQYGVIPPNGMGYPPVGGGAPPNTGGMPPQYGGVHPNGMVYPPNYNAGPPNMAGYPENQQNYSYGNGGVPYQSGPDPRQNYPPNTGNPYHDPNQNPNNVNPYHDPNQNPNNVNPYHDPNFPGRGHQ